MIESLLPEELPIKKLLESKMLDSIAGKNSLTNNIFKGLNKMTGGDYDETYNDAKLWMKEYLLELKKVDDKYKERIAELISKFI